MKKSVLVWPASPPPQWEAKVEAKILILLSRPVWIRILYSKSLQGLGGRGMGAGGRLQKEELGAAGLAEEEEA